MSEAAGATNGESPENFGPEERDGLLLEIQRLKNRIAERDRELKIVNAFVSAVSESLDQNEIREAILDIVMDHFPAIHSAVLGLFSLGEKSVFLSRRTRDSQSTEWDRLEMDFVLDETTVWDEIVISDQWNDCCAKILKETSPNPDILTLTASDGDLKRQLGFLVMFLERGMERTEKEWKYLNALAGNASRAIQSAMNYQMAVKDSLTGFYRKPYFMRQFNRELARSIRRGLELSVFMIDIDHFKRVNDTYGHASGDLTLTNVAERIRAECGHMALVGRYGGEEFVVMCNAIGAEERSALAERIRKGVAEVEHKVRSDGGREVIRCTVSLGSASYPRDSAQAGELVEMADAALYHAKKTGRNRVVDYADVPKNGPA